MARTEIKRDPFARASLYRQTTDFRPPCHWCGSRPGRFTYAWVTDDRSFSYVFWSLPCCSVGCYRDLTGDDR